MWLVKQNEQAKMPGVSARHLWYYIGIGALVQGLIAFDALLATSSVPIPHQWAWATPVLAAVLVFLTTALPRLVE